MLVLPQRVDVLPGGREHARDINSVDIGGGVTLRVGRYGPYIERGEERASVPEDLAPDELTVALAEELLAAPSGDHPLGTDPVSGLQIVAKTGRYGPYVTEVLPETAPKSAKPRTGSLFKDMSLDTVTLEDALRLLSLPRVVGVDPADGLEITAQNGRYGPYLKKGTDSRSIEREDQLLSITLDEALAVYAQPKARGRAAAAPPAARAGRGPRDGEADRHQGRALRGLRHRRRDERDAAQGRHRRGRHRRAGRGAAGREASSRSGEEGCPAPRQEGREEGDQEVGREEDSQGRGRSVLVTGRRSRCPSLSRRVRRRRSPSAGSGSRPST